MAERLKAENQLSPRLTLQPDALIGSQRLKFLGRWKRYHSVILSA